MSTLSPLDIRRAIRIAEAFIVSSDKALNTIHEGFLNKNRYTGAMLRASMDLTLALADLRRGR